MDIKTVEDVKRVERVKRGSRGTPRKWWDIDGHDFYGYTTQEILAQRDFLTAIAKDTLEVNVQFLGPVLLPDGSKTRSRSFVPAEYVRDDTWELPYEKNARITSVSGIWDCVRIIVSIIGDEEHWQNLRGRRRAIRE